MSGTERIILIFLMAILVVSSSPVSSARPAVAIVFDDGWTSQIYKAFPILQANNQTGTVFVITGEVPGATGQSDEMEYMNLSQLNKLYAAGWDLSSHTVTHPYLTTLNASALNTELNASKAYLDNAGFTRGSMFLAYPYGDFNSTVISAVQSNGYVAARTVCGSDPSNMCYFDLTAYPRYNATSLDRYEMVTLMAYGTNSSYSIKRPPAYVINEINNTINSNGFLIITFHFIVDAAATIPEEYNTSDFKAISDYLKSRSADIDVVTLSQFFNGATPTPTPTPTPPPDTIPPTITITTPAATNYTEGSLVLASFMCSDAQSGVKSCTGTVPNGMAINTTGLGTKTFTVNASDNAGNNNSTTVQYIVVSVPPSGSVKIIADKNTWVAQASPTTNYGSDTELIINNVTNAEEAALIHYNLSGQVPAGVTITGATQYMYLRFVSANTLKVNRLTADFVQETTNWNNKPTVGELVTSYLINPSSVGWKQINITSAVKNWYSGTWSNNGLYINSTINDEVDFAQIGDTNQSYIIVNYTSNSPPPQIYIPPTPTISAIIGSDYVLTTWTDGAGNKTDKFNVFLNGVWNNGTTNHSVNQTGMAPGQSSNVSVYAINGTTMNQTPATLVSSIPAPNPLAITGSAPASPVNDVVGAARAFNITLNQTANVTWYINGSQVSSDSNVLVANYTNISAAIGTWNISAVASNNNGSAIQTWIWKVTASVFNISGFKINDTNGNGNWDSGEMGIENWNIMLLNGTTGTPIGSKSTGAAGGYMFTNLAPGSYNVTEETRAGFTPTNATFRAITIVNRDITNVNFTNIPNATTAPIISFTDPTPNNNSTISTNYAQINLSISEQNLDTFKFNWNGINYSFYDPSLILAFNFNNNSEIGETATRSVDISRYGNNGTISGAAIIAGKFGNALQFDGINDYVTISDSSSLDTVSGSENFTLEAWVYPKDWVNYRGIINKRSSYYYSASPGGLFSDANGIRVVIGTGNDGQTFNSVSYKPSLNEWHYVVGTANGSILKLYVDGVLRGSTAITVNPPSNSDPLTIGSFFGSIRSFNGTIDEVRIYDRNLSADEIAMHYQSEFQKYSSVKWGFYNNITNLAYGVYTYYGWANDIAGNSNSSEIRTVTFRDNVPPVVYFISPTPDNNSILSTNYTQINLSINEQDLNAFKFNWNGTNYSFYDSSLVLALNFNNNSAIGETAIRSVDISRYGNNGTINGAIVAAGRFGNALQFDGINDYVTISDSSSLDTVFGSENFTLEAWVYPKDWVNYRGIINKKSSYYYSASSGGLFSDANGIRVVIGTGNDAQTSNSVSYKPSLNEWHHVVGTANGSTLRLYVDGVLRGSTAITVNPPSNSDPLTIGSFFGSIRSFNGTIDEVRIYNRSLLADEIRMHYQSEFQKYSSAEWRFYNNITDLASGNYLYYGWANDTSGNSNSSEVRTVTINVSSP